MTIYGCFDFTTFCYALSLVKTNERKENGKEKDLRAKQWLNGQLRYIGLIYSYMGIND